ncbi:MULTISPECIES: helix-turn-helix transcriptional regulator [unclassified Streptomyces]|uniref:helix-turn-helix transcriptional regulator n=1 Tax=unclassified Streptomyces TaxID=2593676 RepID=UPI002E2A7638|nr:helix-turn-helix transcriptional regulator [Streptomyces sp. NBC_01423]WSX95003.1 helix-turn-helix transcriptional regulator [Streptomyces sp. NBC_00891]WSY09483.1 helix-turn-helix transcriptional regulator [Streptomyces sp. NBC_00890]WSZ11104.1 helix-turn-helix transcriptional regulator [Streptomyces sp. NBC_00869]WSZ21391.1 helix-turn-helix transcriptional regulator [Streptomyces sp. NBC_00870]
MTLKRPDLADFLRRSRERLTPRDVGLVEGPRRRTPGLRREEVAVLAGMSADYYMRLEQARGPQPSVQVLGALAGALRLTEDERDHLFVLAGHRPPEGARAGEYLRPGLRYLLDRLDGVPVQVVSDLGDLLAQNDLALALFGCVCTVADEDRNIVVRWFTDPGVRGHFAAEEHEQQARQLVADLRAATARRGDDAASHSLVARLRSASPEFVALWDRHEVAVRRSHPYRLVHPDLGRIELDCEVLATPAVDQRLRIFTPPPGGTSVLDELRVLGPRHRHG